MIWDGSRPSKHPSILLIPSNKLAASAVHPVPWGIWKGDPGDLSRGIRVLQSLEAAAVPSCFSLSLSLCAAQFWRSWWNWEFLTVSFLVFHLPWTGVGSVQSHWLCWNL